MTIYNDTSSNLLIYNVSPEIAMFTAYRQGILPCEVLIPRQTHSSNVAIIDKNDFTREDLYDIDALITNLPGIAIGVKTADCIPILLYDPVKKCVGAAHSGWRGSINKIAAQTVLAMSQTYRSNPSDILAVIGPGIGPDNFQVGEDVAEMFKDSGFPPELVWSFRGPRIPNDMSGGHHIDLWDVCRITLLECGLRESNILSSKICTYQDKRFYSARREGQQCGRNINAIMLK